MLVLFGRPGVDGRPDEGSDTQERGRHLGHRRRRRAPRRRGVEMQMRGGAHGVREVIILLRLVLIILEGVTPT